MKIFERKFRASGQDGPEYKIFGFDRQAYHSGSLDFLRRWGPQTNMHSVFALLGRYDATEESGPAKVTEGNSPRAVDDSDESESVKKGKVAGAVVFTDGQVDDKNIAAYLAPSARDLPVVIVGIGSKDPRSDVAVKSIEAPSRVMIDTAYAVEVAVTGRNVQNQSVTVELLKDDYVIASQELAAKRFPHGRNGRPYGGLASREVTVEFAVGADRLGRHALSARAKAIEQEINVANNVRSTMVEVVEEASLKALFYSQEANFNIGKVRQALARDSKIDLDLGLDVIKGRELSEQVMKTCGYVKLPNGREGFYKYDVIILGPCVLEHLTDAQIDGLYSFVVDRGGGLILLPGRARSGPAAWDDEKAKALIPIIFDRDRQAAQQPPGKIELTAEGLDSKIIKRVELQEYDIPASAHYRVIDKKPAATTLASVKELPIVTVHRVGRGRVCFLNVSRLFRWYREDLEGGLLHRFMTGLTAYVGRVRSTEAAIEMFAERASDETNTVKFDAYVYDRLFAPVGGGNVLLTAGDEVLSMDEVGRGYYCAEVKRVSTESIIATVEAEINGMFLGEKAVAVNLPLPETEMTNVELDEKFLRALAKKLDGRYLGSREVTEDVAAMFESETCVAGASRMISVWPSWLLFLVLCLILVAGWFLRRSVGLV
jgi:hypothetical protein